MTENAQIGLLPYVTRFLVAFVLLQIAVLALVQVARLPGSPGIMIGTIVGAAVVAGHKFLRDHKRPFSDGEKLRMTLYSLAVVLALYGLRLMLGFAHLAERMDGVGGPAGGTLEAIRSIEPKILLTLVGGTAAIAFISLFFSYAFLMALIYRGMVRRGEL